MNENLSIEDLLARMQIEEVQYNYARGIDRRDWARYRSVFADEVQIDFSTWSGLNTHMRADDWVERVRGNLSGFDATQHVMTNLQYERDATGIVCSVQMMAIHTLVESDVRHFQVIGGYYTNHYVATERGWKVDRCNLNVSWEQGDRALFSRAKARWSQAQAT